MSIIKRKYSKSYFNKVMNAMTYMIDAMKKADEEKYKHTIRAAQMCQQDIIKYSTVVNYDDTVKVCCPDNYYEYLIRAEFYVDDIEGVSGYDVDYGQKVEDETEAWREEMRRRRLMKQKFYYDGWIEYQKEHAGEKRVTKKAYADYIGHPYDKVRLGILAYEEIMRRQNDDSVNDDT